MLIFFWNAPSLTLTAGTGSYSLNGQAVQFELTHLEAGSFVLNGQSVTFSVSPEPFRMGYGAFTLTGEASFSGRASSRNRILITDSPNYGDQLFKPGV